MSKTIVKPTLSLGNHIYLYRLLRDAIGCGKQTFMTQVEETLAAGDMTAYDLGFESTRELLEELDDCIKLTVFKGGRLYATVIANEAWDAALAKGEDKPKAAKGAKQSYKKKKRGEKDLKAVRPKHVKRPEPESVAEVAPEPEPEVEAEVTAEVTAEVETEIAATTEPEVMAEQEAAVELNEVPKSKAEETAGQPETPAFQNSDVFGDNAEDDQSDEPANQDATEATPEPETPQPAISLTVVYDPENANAGITTMVSTPVEAKSSVENENATQVEVETAVADAPVTVKPADSEIKPKVTPEPAPVIESMPAAACDQIPASAPASLPAAAPAPAPAAPAIPKDFPVDFATEVFCPGPLLHQLSTYLPYGADTLGIVGEYYWIARERGTIEAARNRASFPLRYTQAGERHEVTVRIRRNTTGGLGATWTIDKVEESNE
ncbi:hypothetical protein [Collinsella aerofaciens]|uniref:hypothetical protein n=1 Tax=Collinsella aerofaciens TaxID=74426 RepID=UPI00232C4F19|nr:hypothetical protein [Collinsella aerofaciens]MDB1818536.1 hypothetical protein [Collinsella aerofaciens]MDB1822876.1 hypothetical protein [Collinsella aerofaciens]MDB1824065.1 hypothetical protein [Collinsella aerofaciens]MDB1826021.1 hypothetical protein [Collinsella aerofaciens]MDC0806378.1 hypothetical protein [Collinsella aerofaciens]